MNSLSINFDEENDENTVTQALDAIDEENELNSTYTVIIDENKEVIVIIISVNLIF